MVTDVSNPDGIRVGSEFLSPTLTNLDLDPNSPKSPHQDPDSMNPDPKH
jgi:hypothetical protein